MDFKDLKLDQKSPVYIQIVLYIKQKIILGEVVDGSPLPSRREMAMLLDINPNTVQKAFKLMEEEGFIITKPNQGSVIQLNQELKRRITTELTEDMIKNFIASAKAIQLDLSQTHHLLNQFWGES